MREGRADPGSRRAALVRKPQIGDTRPAPEAERPDVRRRCTAVRKSSAPKQVRRAHSTEPPDRRRTPTRPAAVRRSGAAAAAVPTRCDEAPRARAQRSADRPLPDVRAGPRRHGPGRRARRSQPHRALRVAARRRRQPDPRQHLRRAGPERAARHGGGVRRHRHPEERRAVPRRRAVRRRGHRARRTRGSRTSCGPASSSSAR